MTVSRSSSGTCVLKTSCKGQNTKKVEFAFTCLTPEGELQKHSFGLGGFAAVEEYDTEVTCEACHVPPDVLVMGERTVAKAEEKTSRGEEHMSKGKTAAQVEKVLYGPEQCVATYKSPSGTCIVETDCTEKQLEGYEFGMVCAEADGTLTRHLFGKKSFASKESFDTLIECEQCLGLDDIAENGALVTQLRELKSEVVEMRKDLDSVRAEVKTISDTVEKKEVGKEALVEKVNKRASVSIVESQDKKAGQSFMGSRKGDDKENDDEQEENEEEKEDDTDTQDGDDLDPDNV